jgi:hypothetical protein
MDSLLVPQMVTYLDVQTVNWMDVTLALTMAIHLGLLMAPQSLPQKSRQTCHSFCSSLHQEARLT